VNAPIFHSGLFLVQFSVQTETPGPLQRFQVRYVLYISPTQHWSLLAYLYTLYTSHNHGPLITFNGCEPCLMFCKNVLIFRMSIMFLTTIPQLLPFKKSKYYWLLLHAALIRPTLWYERTIVWGSLTPSIQGLALVINLRLSINVTFSNVRQMVRVVVYVQNALTLRMTYSWRTFSGWWYSSQCFEFVAA
jgi:hypothetical protein